MITLKPWHVAVEWIYTTGQTAIDTYPGALTDDIEEVRKRLDTFSESPTAPNRLKLEKTAEPFISKSLQAFASEYVKDVAWDFLRQEFQTAKDPKLADIARLFAEPDTIDNRTLILIHVWSKITEISKFTILEVR